MTGLDWLAVLQQVKRGDRPALARLTALVTGYLTRFRAYGIRDSWQDVCQEVLIKLLRAESSGQIEKPEAFVAFVGTVTRRCLIDWLRKRGEPASGREDDPGDGDELLAGAGLAREDGPELLADLAAALQELPDSQRAVLAALYLEGHSYEDAAVKLGIPLGTLKRHQTEGLRALRERMGVSSPSRRSDTRLIRVSS